jgi:hypothetical protein
MVLHRPVELARATGNLKLHMDGKRIYQNLPHLLPACHILAPYRCAISIAIAATASAAFEKSVANKMFFSVILDLA